MEGSLKALVVEDDKMSQRLYGMVLNDLGYCADTVSTGLAAIALLEKKHFDVVLMNIGLPGKNGIEVTKIFRRSEKKLGTKTLIIAISAYLDEEIEKNCFDAGCDFILNKTINFLDSLKTHLINFKNSKNNHD